VEAACLRHGDARMGAFFSFTNAPTPTITKTARNWAPTDATHLQQVSQRVGGRLPALPGPAPHLPEQVARYGVKVGVHWGCLGGVMPL